MEATTISRLLQGILLGDTNNIAEGFQKVYEEGTHQEYYRSKSIEE